jgi:hypothetical protein
LADRDAEFEQFAVNPRCAPKWVGLGHLADEIADVYRHLRSSGPSRSALPFPVQPEPSSVPSDDGFGLDQCQRLSPIGPVSQQENPEDSVPIGQARPFRVSFQDIELMTERKVFQGQCASGLQRGEQRAEENENHGSDDIIESS